jgi:hypothetical protein
MGSSAAPNDTNSISQNKRAIKPKGSNFMEGTYTQLDKIRGDLTAETLANLIYLSCSKATLSCTDCPIWDDCRNPGNSTCYTKDAIADFLNPRRAGA